MFFIQYPGRGGTVSQRGAVEIIGCLPEPARTPGDGMVDYYLEFAVGLRGRVAREGRKERIPLAYGFGRSTQAEGRRPATTKRRLKKGEGSYLVMTGEVTIPVGSNQTERLLQRFAWL